MRLVSLLETTDILCRSVLTLRQQAQRLLGLVQGEASHLPNAKILYSQFDLKAAWMRTCLCYNRYTSSSEQHQAWFAKLRLPQEQFL